MWSGSAILWSRQWERLGKAVLVANKMSLLRRYDRAALIRPILFKTVFYCLTQPRFSHSLGHEDAFPRSRLSDSCRFSQVTFAGTRGNGRDAPEADLRDRRDCLR